MPPKIETLTPRLIKNLIKGVYILKLLPNEYFELVYKTNNKPAYLTSKEALNTAFPEGWDWLLTPKEESIQ